jgi:hypothetical protein
VPVSVVLAWLYPAWSAQLELTALKSNKYSGWTTITHPFHPLSGKRFEILSTKTFNKRDILSLKAPGHRTGIIAIPRDWTDKADPDPYLCLSSSPPILSFIHLQHLADLVNMLKQTNINQKNI